ncbi:HDOD domain-containing protein [Aquincola agrisoli]
MAPFVQCAGTLPAMPEVAHTLIRSFSRDDLSLHEVAGLIGRDQTLAAKVLRLANSPRYSPSHSIATLKDAAATLGLRALRDLTLSACMSGAFPAVIGFDRLAFWRSTLALAAYTQPLARALDCDEDIAYLGGLVLRTGQILMLMADPEHAVLVHYQSTAVDSVIGVETRLVGCSHPEITAELAHQWRFPDTLVMALNAAVDPLATRPFNRLGALLRLASVVTDCRDLGVPVDEGLRAAQPALVEHLQLDLPWLLEHLPDHRLATAGVEALVH